MLPIDTIILVSGALLLTGIASSKFSTRFGVPVLVLFLAIGMLAGSEGIAKWVGPEGFRGIPFDDPGLANAIGTFSLALILFDGGLSTSAAAVRSAWKPALALATLGVVVTAGITGLVAAKILGVSPLHGLLLGSIVGSTDAAAVFAVLRMGGIALPKRLQATLEIESGLNDPMAIFLTLGCIQMLVPNGENSPAELAELFARQMAIGGVVGIVGGYVTSWSVNRINLDIGGLYPILVSGFALLTFGMAAHFHGSGFLAVYLAGYVVGNGRLVFKRGILLFHDALAWLSQITMFVVLGLLVFPSRLGAVAWQGLAVAVVLCFVARPVAVAASLWPFRFNKRELGLLSWVGLKGAVPITLATFPLLAKVEEAKLLFDVTFFVVVLSALVQGWSLPLVAQKLGLMMPAEGAPPVSLEISSLRFVEGDIVDYTVTDDSRAAGKLVRELALPDGCTIAMIARQEQLIPPQGQTRIEAGDHVIIVLKPGVGALVNQVFARIEAREDLPLQLEFPLRASISVAELEEFYGFNLQAPPTETLDGAIRRMLGSEPPRVGSVVRFGEIALRVRELNGSGAVTQVGMVVLSSDDQKL